MPGHAPYIMPDGQPLARYLTLEGEKKPRKKSKCKKGGSTIRAKDLVWNQLLLAGARLSNVEGMDPAALAELQSVQNVGHRRRRRWINDRLLRDMAGPMTAKDMESNFNPPPWGEEIKPSALSVLLHESDVWDIFRNIDMDKEAKLLKKWESQYAANCGKKKKDAAWDCAFKALEQWALFRHDSRFALKKSNPHSVLEMEMHLLEWKEKVSPEPLVIESTSVFSSLVWRGLAQFYSLRCSASVSGSRKIFADVLTISMRDLNSELQSDLECQDSLKPIDALEITCTDVLLAMQEYRCAGLNVHLLARFVVTQIHGLEEEYILT